MYRTLQVRLLAGEAGRFMLPLRPVFAYSSLSHARRLCGGRQDAGKALHCSGKDTGRQDSGNWTLAIALRRFEDSIVSVTYILIMHVCGARCPNSSSALTRIIDTIHTIQSCCYKRCAGVYRSAQETPRVYYRHRDGTRTRPGCNQHGRKCPCLCASLAPALTSPVMITR